MNPMGSAHIRMSCAQVGLLTLVQARSAERDIMRAPILRKLAAVLAMVVGFGLATVGSASAAPSVSHANTAGHVQSQLVDWWW